MAKKAATPPRPQTKRKVEHYTHVGEDRANNPPVGLVPLWDLKIANAYGCRYAADPAATYLRFLVKIRGLARAMANVHIEDTTKTVVKLIDEYNYARFPKGWI